LRRDVFERILVPLDGSPAAEVALAFVDMIPGRQVTLLQVVPDSGVPMYGGTSAGEVWRTTQETEANAYLSQVGAPLRRQDHELATVTAFGDPADWIIAHGGDADLIVMTTHGRGAGGRALFGSVADRVARQAPTPTLLVRADQGRAAAIVTRILVPLDGSDMAREALPLAAALARELGVPVHLVRVIDDDVVRASVVAGAIAAQAYAQKVEAVRLAATEELAAAAAALRDQGIEASTEVLSGFPAAALLEVIAATDLIVMTTHGRGGIQRLLLGSVAETLVREATAPVLLLRAGASG
jgi:nucleotide-binding universal stress UspA family protein